MNRDHRIGTRTRPPVAPAGARPGPAAARPADEALRERFDKAMDPGAQASMPAVLPPAPAPLPAAPHEPLVPVNAETLAGAAPLAEGPGQTPSQEPSQSQEHSARDIAQERHLQAKRRHAGARPQPAARRDEHEAPREPADAALQPTVAALPMPPGFELPRGAAAAEPQRPASTPRRAGAWQLGLPEPARAPRSAAAAEPVRSFAPSLQPEVDAAPGVPRSPAPAPALRPEPADAEAPESGVRPCGEVPPAAPVAAALAQPLPPPDEASTRSPSRPDPGDERLRDDGPQRVEKAHRVGRPGRDDDDPPHADPLPPIADAGAAPSTVPALAPEAPAAGGDRDAVTRTRQHLVEVVERLMVGEVRGEAQVRIELRHDLLPATSVTVQQAAAQLQVVFECSAQASRQHLDRVAPGFARALARRLGRDVVVHVASRDDDEWPPIEITAQAGEAL